MEITPFSLTRMGIPSRIQFFENCLSVIESNDATLLKVTPQFTTLKNCWKELSAMYITDTKNPLTQEIFNLDVQRDECIISLWFLIEGFSHCPLPEMKQAGEVLLRNFSLYANSPSTFGVQKYDVQTNNITNLLNGWTTDPTFMTCVDTLGITPIVTCLSEFNSQFMVKVLERNALYTTEPPVTSKQKLTETSIAFFELCTALNSMCFVTPSPLFTKTINEINTLIETVDPSLKMTPGHKKTTTPENV